MAVEKPQYNIVYACDNNFAPLLAASIKSVEINSPGSIKNIYIIDDGIKPENVEKIKQSFTSPEIILHFHLVKDVMGKNVNIPYFNNPRLPVTTFFRLFIASFMPADTEKVLYLDSDMIVLGDLKELFDLDLSNHIIGAVQDPNIVTLGCSWGGGVQNWEALGYQSDDPYFNAGLLLINFKKWVEFDVTSKALEAAAKYQRYIKWGDQYCLNVVLANRWLHLDPEWNHLVDNNNPGGKLIHYIGNKPIYDNYPYSKAYQDIFFSYLNQTLLKDHKPVTKLQRQIQMVKRFIRKITG
ncbi:glycosyltransferase family 8 protein [Mucilaginibacter ginkgonis]|uniref:Glycosyltransferase family 8 protein n=1 Tax=Mucilaginibacter ginkgonis TaxID=2682091 RepID=A0A6I4HW01_9SPHI|nr:glycosyltransferase family 8 protein [Mucilaginibacter ginkgonis]QQL51014.1 glycosyltransferase family 8 protein [Mucilaginibacter ginkgonis]